MENSGHSQCPTGWGECRQAVFWYVLEKAGPKRFGQNQSRYKVDQTRWLVEHVHDGGVVNIVSINVDNHYIYKYFQ